MFKQSLILIALSLVVLLTMSYAQQGIQSLLTAHDWITHQLANVFSGGQAGNIAKSLIALLCIPVLVGLVAATVYWMIKRHWLPYFMQIVWVVWLVQVGALVIMYQA